MRSKEEIIKSIEEWEYNAGESFLDYFESNISTSFLAGYILAKGYTAWFNEIAAELEKEIPCVFLCSVWWDEDFPSSPFYDSEADDWGSCKNWDKVIDFVADIIVASDIHYKRFEEFLKNN